MTIETLKSPNPRNRNSISVIKSKILSVSSMNTLPAILKVTAARRAVILAGGPYHKNPPPPPPPVARCELSVQTEKRRNLARKVINFVSLERGFASTKRNFVSAKRNIILTRRIFASTKRNCVCYVAITAKSHH